jgi:hypothetical protein
VNTEEDFVDTEVLRATARWRTQTQAAYRGRWFVLVIFGVVTLAAAPFFWRPTPRCPGAGCQSLSHLTAISVGRSPGPLGNPLVYGFLDSGIGRWISLYWVLAVPLGFVATVLYYRHRASRTGVEGRIWPVVIVGLVLLTALVVFSTNFLAAFHLRGLVGAFPVFTIENRGLGPLVVIATAVGVLAFLEHSRSLALFAMGFLALAVLANLNDIEREMNRFGLTLPVGAAALPNVVVPGLFLLGGGLGFWWSDRRALLRSGGGS